jgi:hypothetical protein
VVEPPGPRDLRPDAGVTWLQGALRQAWPVGSDRVEGWSSQGIDAVVDCVDPFDVRAKLSLPGKIERKVHAEAAWSGHWIDETREGRTSAQGEVIGENAVYNCAGNMSSAKRTGCPL